MRSKNFLWQRVTQTEPDETADTASEEKKEKEYCLNYFKRQTKQKPEVRKSLSYDSFRDGLNKLKNRML